MMVGMVVSDVRGDLPAAGLRVRILWRGQLILDGWTHCAVSCETLAVTQHVLQRTFREQGPLACLHMSKGVYGPTRQYSMSLRRHTFSGTRSLVIEFMDCVYTHMRKEICNASESTLGRLALSWAHV